MKQPIYLPFRGEFGHKSFSSALHAKMAQSVSVSMQVPEAGEHFKAFAVKNLGA